MSCGSPERRAWQIEDKTFRVLAWNIAAGGGHLECRAMPHRQRPRFRWPLSLMESLKQNLTVDTPSYESLQCFEMYVVVVLGHLAIALQSPE